MAFTDKDRGMLIKTHTTVNIMKESHERRLTALEDEDRVLHHRINSTRNLFLGLTATISAAVGGIGAWFKSQLGAQ